MATRTLFAILALSTLCACGNLQPIRVVGPELGPTPAEGDRLIESRAAVPNELSFNYDITLSGFASEGPIDLAVLREYCRPGQLVEVLEQPIPFMGTLTAEMWTPRLVTVRCDGGG
jgi:hypothetical protein